MNSYARLLQEELRPAEAAAARAVEPLAHLPYERELQVKNRALATFWCQHGLAGQPPSLLPSPQPRHYRTTTRRRARLRRGRLALGFDADPETMPDVAPSALEPAAHTAIYRFLSQELVRPAARILGARLNHAIIRGSYDTFAVILNLDRLDASIVRSLKGLAKRLPAVDQRILSCFAFHDPSRSDYYIEQDTPPVPVRLKRLYGPPRLRLFFGGRRYDLPPTAFSQVNQSMVEPMLGTVAQLLQPRPHDCLLDLYCGYGLFARALGPSCAQVVGLDADREAIQSAVDGARHDPAGSRITFLRRRITPQALSRSLPAPDAPELIILDPPRQGVDAGIISTLARRRPRRVLHLCCGIETVPGVLRQWANSGFQLAQCAPLDMFAGTDSVELLLLLEPRAPARSQRQTLIRDVVRTRRRRQRTGHETPRATTQRHPATRRHQAMATRPAPASAHPPSCGSTHRRNDDAVPG